MKYWFLFLLFITARIISAQPTVTSSISGTAGDVFSYEIMNADGFDVGADGADVTWDFSDITSTGSNNEYTFVTAASTPYDFEFTDANLAQDDGAGNYTYYNSTSSVYAFYGAAILDVVAVYDDPEQLFVFPFSFGSTNTDDLHCEFTSGVEFERAGTTTLEADAYGTLILPSGTYTDVLRIKTIQDYSDDAIGYPVLLNYYFQTYFWVKEGIKGSLLEYAEQEVTGSFPSSTQTLLMNDNILISTIQNQEVLQLSVFPVPANEYVHISFQDKVFESSILSVYNFTGNIVLQTEMQNANMLSLDISFLPPGIYTAILSDGSRIAKNKFVVQ